MREGNLGASCAMNVLFWRPIGMERISLREKRGQLGVQLRGRIIINRPLGARLTSRRADRMVAVEKAVAVVMQESGRRALFDATQRLGANYREKAGLIKSVASWQV